MTRTTKHSIEFGFRNFGLAVFWRTIDYHDQVITGICVIGPFFFYTYRITYQRSIEEQNQRLEEIVIKIAN